jgi:eukaryotic-like serine/threonine-protein kinase
MAFRWVRERRGIAMSASRERIGRYEVKQLLGQGAMGSVYEALDPLIERVVALKTINLALSNNEREVFQARFFREAKSIGRLNHPNIVMVYDVGEDEGNAYIAMEFLSGQTLRDVIDSGVVLPLARIRDMALAIAEGLAYAHANGVVHRDIKPANIMVLPDQNVKIMDFGIAQLPTGSQTIHGTVLGSPKYMAPEQITGKTVDGRADVFSLGAMVYELLVGRVPFDAESLSSIMYKIVHESAQSPSQISARIPAAFDAVVMRALAKDPSARFQTASDFARSLQALELKNESIAATPARAATKEQSANEATIVLPPLESVQTSNANALTTGAPEPIDSTTELPQKRRISPIFWGVQGACLIAIVGFLAWPDRKATPDAPEAPTQQSSDKSSSDGATPKTPPLSVAAPTAKADDNSQTKSPESPVAVALAIYPWGEVWVNGNKVGVSPPLNELKLRPGRHVVEIRNDAQPAHRETIVVEAGDTTKKIRHRFQ